MTKMKSAKGVVGHGSPEGRDLLSTPLLQEQGDEDDTDDQTDSPRHSSGRTRGAERARARGFASNSGGGGGARVTRVPQNKVAMQQQQLQQQQQQQGRRVAASGRLPRAPSVPRSQDYRSEGEQPSTERNGSRRPLSESRQDSFRLSRLPKRGGRKRLRRARPVRKIRVSSYCVARELKTLQLLRWLETQPNRRLSQSIRAEGRAVPQGRAGAATITASAAAAVAAAGNARRRNESRGASRDGVGAAAGGGPSRKPTEGVEGVGGGAGAGSTIDQLEWMDSLYIDVIHSTTDLRGGIRKARALERSVWEDAPEDDGAYDAGVDDDRGEGRWERERAREREEEDDDEFFTHRDVIYFPYGAVVFWGCSEAEEKEMLSNLNRFILAKVSETELAESFDDMTFVYRHPDARKSVPLKNDEITLDTRDPAEKLAYSCALAQSAKLFVFEERLNNTIESTAKYPQMLAATGKIPLTEVQIGRLVGQVLCEQNEVNLHSDILDTPEYFWEEDAWEPAYEALTAYLDMPLRVDNLNTRLTILKELLDVLSTQSTNAHATRLEVIIIYLIFVEVAIELVWNVIIKDVFRLVGEDHC